jgi:hypothetical protein
VNWYAELRQKLVQAGFKISREASQHGAALLLVVVAPGGGKAAVRDRYAQTITNIMAPYSVDPMEKWAKQTGNPMPPEEEEDMGGGFVARRRSSRGAAVIPSYPPQPGSYDVIFTPLYDDPPHNDGGEQSFAEAIVEALLESVAVDLDGTLAKDSGWKGPEHIGEPVKPMLDLVKKLLDDGEEVVIFTARAHDGEKSTKDHIRDWLKDHDLPDLEITNEKRPDMEKFYDDKAVAVEKNRGPA